MSKVKSLKLGLIGDNIARSRAPMLHGLAGQQTGVAVTYDRLVPKQMEQEFDAVFDGCVAGGFDGINVTYPYKERVVRRVSIEDPLVRAIGAVNTVLFRPEGPQGFNTDYTGFVAAYRLVRGQTAPGICCLVGTGGVGRALAFALVALGAEEIRLVDLDLGRADALADDIRSGSDGVRVLTLTDAGEAARNAAGVLNGTPVGMVGYPGSPVPRDALVAAEWVFDAVYTPVETEFLTDARAAGAAIISGYELFFFQGVHAWDLFAGLPLDQDALRAALLENREEPA